MHVFVCMHSSICTDVCVCLFIYVHIYIYVYIYIYMCIYIYISLSLSLSLSLHLFVYESRVLKERGLRACTFFSRPRVPFWILSIQAGTESSFPTCQSFAGPMRGAGFQWPQCVHSEAAGNEGLPVQDSKYQDPRHKGRYISPSIGVGGFAPTAS